ncbi:DUF1015 domain-containing protein [Desulfococcus sp.]|uniref:DUF1015 domain-containing protein n=1 Tax=Desulfococcus sp. TaxID=2025834 RepID=UPI003593784D
MAEVIPFRGIVYNQERITDLAAVCTPPYDVISPEEQERFYGTDPYNVIRLILARTSDSDTAQDNRYTRAGREYDAWLREGILVRDELPAFYLTTIDFDAAGHALKRYGLIARVRLEPFEKGVVLPHETTFSKVKSDRFELMKVCHANFSPIFSLYSDRENILETLMAAVIGQAADMAFTDTYGHHHRLWRITDPAVTALVSKKMAAKTIYIADGHHRYETALTYRDWVAGRTPGFTDAHPANHVMMYLSSMEDPGMVILPAHRMLKEVDPGMLAGLLPRAAEFFDITEVSFDGKGSGRVPPSFSSALEAGADRHTIGVFTKGLPNLFLLSLKPGVMKARFGDALPAAVRDLDVTVLTRLIFMDLLGFDQARLDNEKLIAYATDPRKAVDGVLSGAWDVTFILNPTRIEQVQAVAQSGLIMPRKSTYFYPKVITGQTLNPLV